MKVLVLANFGMGLYQFRKELLTNLIQKKCDVFISLPEDEYVEKMVDMGCIYVKTEFNRRGINPLADLRLIYQYIKIMREIMPDIVLTYTIKPNVYGGIACRITKVPYVTNITGLGTSIEKKGLLKIITLMMYRLGLSKASCVFFQNTSNQEFFVNNGIVKGNNRLLPGSGVNLHQHRFEPYPEEAAPLRFVFIGRMMKAKGIDELIQAAKIIKEKYPQVNFDLVGGCEEYYDQKLKELNRDGIINYHGKQEDVHEFLASSHAIILPSYHEGLANVLLEAASTGRPILASKVPGCIETFDDSVSGFGFEVKNADKLVEAVEKFIQLPHEHKKMMGIAGRKKMEKQFDRDFVVHCYLEEMSRILGKEI